MARWKARGRVTVSANGTFSPALAVRAYERSKSLCLKGVGHFERKFQGLWRCDHQRLLVRILESMGLSRGVVCVILCLAVLTQCRRVTDRKADTYTQTHDDV